jgi:hypothetical protein
MGPSQGIDYLEVSLEAVSKKGKWAWVYTTETYR